MTARPLPTRAVDVLVIAPGVAIVAALWMLVIAMIMPVMLAVAGLRLCLDGWGRR